MHTTFKSAVPLMLLYFEEEDISQSMLYILMGLQSISPPHFEEGAATKEMEAALLVGLDSLDSYLLQNLG